MLSGRFRKAYYIILVVKYSVYEISRSNNRFLIMVCELKGKATTYENNMSEDVDIIIKI